ncbi:hypothetical protein Ancab_000254 [Ancistrocladus abbreviatus]
MWRSIAARASYSIRARLKLRSLLHHHQVLQQTFNSTPNPSFFPINVLPGTFLAETPRFSSQSVNPSEFEPEDTHHNNESHVEASDYQNFETNTAFDDTHGPLSSSDAEEKVSVFNEIYENNNTQMDSFDNLIEVGNGDVNDIDIEKLEYLLSLLQSTVDGSLESTLDGLDLTLHEEFVLRVLKTPYVPAEHLIRFFKWSLLKEFVVTHPVLEALVCAEIGSKENSLLNPKILNGLISSFSQLGKGKAAFEVFSKFEDFGCVPDVDTYYLTVEALCKRSFHDWAWSVCEKMLNSGILPESEKIGEMISSFCKGSKTKEAHLLYLSAKENNRYPPHNAVNFLISSLSNGDETMQLALEMLDDFSGEAQKYAINPFSNVVYGNAVFNVVISSLSKAGDMDEAMQMLRLMEKRGLKPDVYTYSVIMSGYTKGGLMDEACKVLVEAKKKHSRLCPATYHTLIRGYCKLKEYDKALNLLNEMEEYGVQPNVDEYNKLIQSLCLQALDWKTAEKLLEEMKGKGLYLPGITRVLYKQ